MPIYTRSEVQRQLDLASSAFMHRTVSVTARPSPDGPASIVLTLPKVFHWFARDFGAGTPTDGAAAAMAYLTGPRRELLRSCLVPGAEGKPDLNVTYASFSFACSRLSELRFEEAPAAG